MRSGPGYSPIMKTLTKINTKLKMKYMDFWIRPGMVPDAIYTKTYEHGHCMV